MCDAEVKIVMFVLKGGAKLTVLPHQQEYIQLGSRGVALLHVSDLKSEGQGDTFYPDNSLGLNY